ncbi:hypothetical protein Tco_1052040 [Tanacetum coccineum]
MIDNIQKWYIRPEGEAFVAEFVYGEYSNLFSIKFYYGGRFTDSPNKKYVEGYGCDEAVFFHYKIPLKSLDNHLKPLTSDCDISNMLEYVHKHMIMYVYVEHGHTTVGTNSEQPINKRVEIMEFDQNVNVEDVDDQQCRIYDLSKHIKNMEEY